MNCQTTRRSFDDGGSERESLRQPLVCRASNAALNKKTVVFGPPVRRWFVLLWAASMANAALAHPGHGPSPSSKPAKKIDKSFRQPVRDLDLADFPMQPRYGGQVTAAKWHYFEVVYAPHELRIYVYSPSQRQLYARHITGEVVIEVFSSGQTARFPVRSASQQIFGNNPGYLSVPVDLSRVRKGDMRAVFKLDILTQDGPQVEFEQTFDQAQPENAATEPRIVRLPPINAER